MKLNSLNDLYMEELRDLYNAEKQITKALPKMMKKATSPELKSAFEEHLEVTNQQIQRLEQIFEKMGKKPTGKVCKAMQGIIEEGEETMGHEGDPAVMDAALIAAAQRVEHYEIAGYGCCRTYAKMLGETEAAKLLQQTLDEEEQTDAKLNKIAESSVNKQAMKANA
jgi:ferritin-like metal-binding protein YciE